MTNFAERLTYLRKKAKYTQNTLAGLLGLSQRQISKYEKEQDIPNLNLLIKLCDVFNVSIDYLIGLSSKNESEKIWIQNQKDKRLSIFKKPEGQFEYKYFADGEENKSIFKYVFGILTSEQYVNMHKTMFKSSPFVGDNLKFGTFRFFFINEIEGVCLKRIVNAQSNLEFLAFVRFLNEKFCIGDCCNIDKEGYPVIHLITQGTNKIVDTSVPTGYYSPISKYCYMLAKKDYPVFEYGLDPREEMLINIYLGKPLKDKIDFLNKNIDEAFKW